jgi:putative membrane protein
MHHHGHSFSMVVPILLVAAAALAYLVLATGQRGRKWNPWRTALFLTGCAVLCLGFLPRYLPYAEGDFRKHMLQHLLIGMLAPLGLVMAAPVTLLLRSVPGKYGRLITGFLSSGPLQVIAHPITALVLNVGGLAALYFTPLYVISMTHPALHYVLHFHFVAAGCLYTWVIAGPDPAPHRPSVPVRLIVLGVAITLHSVLAQMLYAGAFAAVPASHAELEGGATLMYYGGDLAEILLAFAMVSTWQPHRSALKPQAA